MNNQESKQDMEHFKKEMTQLHTDLSKMTEKVDEMYFALMGNKLAKDGGLVKRIENLEQNLEEVETNIETLVKKNVGFEVYQKVIWGAVGTIIGLIFSYVIQVMISK